MRSARLMVTLLMFTLVAQSSAAQESAPTDALSQGSSSEPSDPSAEARSAVDTTPAGTSVEVMSSQEGAERAEAKEPPPEEDATVEEALSWQPPEHRLFYRSVLITRTNPGGLQGALELAYRYRLMDSESVLFRDSFVGLALKPMITPAFARLGIAAQAQPLAILYLEAAWNLMGWYGVLGHPRTFADGNEDYSDTAITELADKGEPGATVSWELDLIAELRAKVGPVVIRNRLSMILSELTPPQASTDTLYYDPLYDLLRPRSGWSMTNDADVLVYLLDEHLIVGARYTVGHAFLPGDAGNEPNHRLGPLVAYRFFLEPGATIDAPTAILLVQWHLDHPYRTGQDVSQALPYIVAGFSLQGDLL